ncbi:Fumarylacetoacetase [Thermothelomyces heterothallicus CBS 203.75]
MASSWVPDMDPASDFSLANIPFGIISTPADSAPHAAVAIGSFVLDLKVLSANVDLSQIFPGIDGLAEAFSQPTLNAFAQMGRVVHRRVRSALQDLLSKETAHPAVLRDNAALRSQALLPQSAVRMHLPMAIGDYTDFYAGYHHAFAVGAMFRGPENALQPNYLHLPVGYHGRASSVVVSGTPIRRPVGQILPDPAAEPKRPVTAPSRKLDIELELGCFIARGNHMGDAIPVGDAEEHIFGYVLLNDWSARDVQTWEYVPLGPFNGKNFATTISPWVVLADALEPFRTRGIENSTELQDYLKEPREERVFDVRLEVDLTTAEGTTTTIGRTSSRHLIWSFPQMIAHHTLGGCPLRPGDLLGSGTISGPGGVDERGSLLEMTENGKKEVQLVGMDARTFLKDGDTITLRGFCGEEGARVGFGECRGKIYGAVLR